LYSHKLIRDQDFVLDCSDNFPTRFVINEVCFKEAKPLIFAAVKGFLGQVSVFKAYENNNPCYACFNPNIVGEGFSLPLSEKGILGSVAGTFGAMQATNVVKEILEIGESLVGKVLISDLLKNDVRKVRIQKNSSCKVCS
jgi:adenylyltransferase/sulfurtransferase